jgi:hypothetical protein
MVRCQVSDFVWDEQSGEYRCPQGFALRSERRNFKQPRDHVTKEGTIIYRSSQHDCAGCSLKQSCCPNTPIRKIARSVHEDARDVGRAIARRRSTLNRSGSARRLRCSSPI